MVSLPRALRAGAAAGPLFVAAAVVQALTRPGFNLTRNALSLLTGVSIALLWAAFTITRLTVIRSLP